MDKSETLLARIIDEFPPDMEPGGHYGCATFFIHIYSQPELTRMRKALMEYVPISNTGESMMWGEVTGAYKVFTRPKSFTVQIRALNSYTRPYITSWGSIQKGYSYATKYTHFTVDAFIEWLNSASIDERCTPEVLDSMF